MNNIQFGFDFFSDSIVPPSASAPLPKRPKTKVVVLDAPSMALELEKHPDYRLFPVDEGKPRDPNYKPREDYKIQAPPEYSEERDDEPVEDNGTAPKDETAEDDEDNSSPY